MRCPHDWLRAMGLGRKPVAEPLALRRRQVQQNRCLGSFRARGSLFRQVRLLVPAGSQYVSGAQPVIGVGGQLVQNLLGGSAPVSVFPASSVPSFIRRFPGVHLSTDASSGRVQKSGGREQVPDSGQASGIAQP